MINVKNSQCGLVFAAITMRILLLAIIFGGFCNVTYGQEKANTKLAAPLLQLKSVSKQAKRTLQSDQYFYVDPMQLKLLRSNRQSNIHLSLPFLDKQLQFSLQEVKLFSPDFKLLNADNQVTFYEKGRYLQYASRDTIINVSIFQDRMLGNFTFGARSYSLGKLEEEKQIYSLRPNTLPPNLDRLGACHTADELDASLIRKMQSSDKKQVETRRQLPPIDLYFELDRYTFREFGSSMSRTMDFFTGVFNGVAQIYLREGITVRILSVKVWDRNDPFQDASATAALTSFKFYLRNNVKEQPWDAAMLLSRYSTDEHPAPHGGVAGLDALCDGSKRHGYANILGSYKDFPDYSWTVFVITHELGHIFGSPHAHNCFWPGGPIDNCYCSEGNCDPGPDPGPLGGTIMSYCYLDAPFSSSCKALPDAPNPGVNFLNGFGLYPGNLIRASIDEKRCLERKSKDTLANLRALDSFQVVQRNQEWGFKNILINNFGLATTDSFDLTLMQATDLADERTYQKVVSINLPALGPGQSISLDTSISLSASPNQNWVWQIDANHQVAEWNEGDNFIFANGFIQELSPDLVVSGFGKLEAFPQYFLIRDIEVENQGGQAVSGARIDFYLSKDQLFDKKDLLIGSTTLPNLAAGERHSIHFSQYKGSLLIPVGEYYLAYQLVLNNPKELAENNQGFLQVEDPIMIDWTWWSLFKGRFK